MARLKVNINDKLLERVGSTAEQLWPAQGARALAHFVRDAIRRYVRYWNDTARR